jgi:hypothetical protein
MWKTVRAARAPSIRKYVQSCGGRRVGDRIAFVTNPQLLLDGRSTLADWLEDKSFEENTALRDMPGLRPLLERARHAGIAWCIKG